MKLNPFENIQNEYELNELLEHDAYCLKIKDKFQEKFNEGYISYEFLLKTINSQIDWHKKCTGGYQGDYYCVGFYNKKIYFVQIGYGSCSGCDALLACFNDLQAITELQGSIKSQIREFETLEELINWINDAIEWWIGDKDEILDFVKTFKPVKEDK